MGAKNKSNEIVITRVYDAPVKLVWEAWTNPKQVAQWWGPRGFTLTTHSKDLRPGGIWHYTMYGPDGTDYPNKTLYHEVEKEKRLVYDHGGYDDRPSLFRVTAEFAEVDGKTRIDMRMTLPTPEAAAETRAFIKLAGGNATWDRLAEYLEKNATGKEHFVINRTFDVPIETLYDMWTSPEHFVQWLPPTGFTMKFLKCDMREGGSSVFVMSNDAGMQLRGRTQYLEMKRPDRIVYTQQFVDENENISRHPMAPVWPETMLTTVALAAEVPDATRVTVTWQPYGAVTPEEIDAFVNERGGMTLGWSGSFDKLEAYLESAVAT
ncbi:MAG: SRPBCC family protein [Candidatus Hydrogenedentes bacterium]|nr:SRPBCC family protein [Candidatus Hydrogenedentota bacterium]